MATLMILRLTLVCNLLTIVSAPAAAAAAADVFHITDAEKAACTQDAERLCSSAYPDGQQLLACLKANRAALGPACRPVFDAGLKRRGL